jgi:pimeloyl-ACP methyl ester carboxylesterase
VISRLFLVLTATTIANAQAPSPVGIWEGALAAGGVRLRIALHIGSAPDGVLKATLDSIDQNVRGIPVTDVLWDPPSLRLALPPLRANYIAKMDETGNTLDGIWSQGDQQLPLSMKRVEKASELLRPQTPKPPFPYREQPVTVRNAADDVNLEGTLTLPPAREGLKFPALLLISGSGPQDRDATMFGHKPFAVIADALTRKGFAVLRLDDRGTGKSKGSFRAATTQDFLHDAAAALDFLRSRESIDPKRIGLFGHSEGAIVAAMLAAKRPDDVAFLVTYGGPGIPMSQLLIEQGEAVLKASGAPAEVIEKQRKTQEAMFPLLLSDKGSIEIKTEIDAILKTEEMSSAERSVADAQTSQALSPWFRGLLAIDPAKYFEKVRCPVLALNGGNDTQVAATSNLAAIAAALKRGGNSNFETAVLPKVNHLFQTSETGAPSEYGTIEETMSPEVMDRLTKWLSQFTSR